MMKTIIFLLALGLSVSAQAVAPQESVEIASGDKDACILIDRIRSFRVLDNNTVVLLSMGSREAYLMKLGMPLPELKFAHRYAYIDRDRDGQICGRAGDRLIVPDASFRVPSTIMAMTRLDPEQVAALEAKYGVRLTRKEKTGQATAN
jgi:hypothetical protein